MMTLLRPNCIGSENMIFLVKLDGVGTMVRHANLCKSLCGSVVERRRRAHVLDDRLPRCLSSSFKLLFQSNQLVCNATSCLRPVLAARGYIPFLFRSVSLLP